MRTPVLRTAWSYPLRWTFWMTTSGFMPVRSGSCRTFCVSLPVSDAHVPRQIAPAAPEVTNASSHPMSAEIRLPTSFFSSSSTTYSREACAAASCRSSHILEAPMVVIVPMKLMTGRMPSRSYGPGLRFGAAMASDGSALMSELRLIPFNNERRDTLMECPPVDDAL